MWQRRQKKSELMVIKKKKFNTGPNRCGLRQSDFVHGDRQNCTEKAKFGGNLNLKADCSIAVCAIDIYY